MTEEKLKEVRRLCLEQVAKVADQGWKVLPSDEGNRSQTICLLYTFMPVLTTDQDVPCYSTDARRALGLTLQEAGVLERGFEGWGVRGPGQSTASSVGGEGPGLGGGGCADDAALYQLGQDLAEHCRQKFIEGGAA